MTTDVFYGADCELRIGLMADKDTDPTRWWSLPFISFTPAPQRERIDRPKLGAPRHNPLDPIKPIPGFLRLAGDLVVDADAAHLPVYLHCLLGEPVTTGAGPYTHVFASGSPVPRYAALQLKVGASDIRVYRGFTLASLAAQIGAEQTRNFDIQLSLRGLSRGRVTSWLSGDLEADPAESVIHRAVFRRNGTAAENILDGSYSWDRQISEDAFLSTEARLSGVRPGGGLHTGQARFRAVGEAFDILEEEDTVSAFDFRMLGATAGHEIRLEHSNAMLAAAPLAIPGPGLIERTFSWTSHQTASAPASKITVINATATYEAEEE